MFLNEVQEGYMQYLGNVLIHIAYYGRKIKKNEWKLIEGLWFSESNGYLKKLWYTCLRLKTWTKV